MPTKRAKIHRDGSVEGRKLKALEAFQCASATIGPIVPGMHVFAITRGQFSMIDAILHTLDQLGPSEISLWTWCIAEYEVQVFERLMMDKRLTEATLVIDPAARNKSKKNLEAWRARFGNDSVRWVYNHAKLATVRNSDKKVLIRGSMNLNYNPRFEQFDLSEGCAGFDVVHKVESELQIFPPDCVPAQISENSKLREAYTAKELAIFPTLKVWAK